MISDEKPETEKQFRKISDIFRDFANMLDEPRHMEEIAEDDQENELIKLVTSVQNYARDMCGVKL